MKRNTKISQIQDWLLLGIQANWSVQKLAEICGVSTRTLERRFSQKYGISPKAWLKQERQKQAVELLQDQASVKETASLVGYSHASTFTREFKKLTGQCPNEFAGHPRQKSSGSSYVA